MKLRLLSSLAAATAAFLLPAAAEAELPVGAAAPQFVTQGALAGKAFTFDLRQALRRGPVVLYFYPKAFTQGCTAEAHAFAEASAEFHAAGATVIGMSADDLPTLQRFSREACRDKFAVAVATPEIVRRYDVALHLPPEMAAHAASLGGSPANRTSYVVAQDGRIRFVHSNLDWRDHVRLTLQAVQDLQKPR